VAAVHTADCLPIAIGGEGAVAMLHAGWRGLAGGVVAAGVTALRELGADGELHAAIGPGAGGCCYEVGEELSGLFPDFVTGRLLDLKAVAAAQLREAGVGEVRDVGVCTICAAPERLFSHRRDGPGTGRQGGFAWLR
jgi:copper oxidase (laccase) domain-containing protein